MSFMFVWNGVQSLCILSSNSWIIICHLGIQSEFYSLIF
jgi:hypothetical protein